MAEPAEGIYLDEGDKDAAKRMLAFLSAKAENVRQAVDESPPGGIIHLDNYNTVVLSMACTIYPPELRDAATEDIDDACRIALRDGGEPECGTSERAESLAMGTAACLWKMLDDEGLLRDASAGMLRPIMERLRQQVRRELSD